MCFHSINILTYHSISEGPGPTCIAPQTFAQQIEILVGLNYRAVSLNDIATWIRDGQKLPERSIVLTFDDGYEDFVTHAFPRLRALGWTATVFLPAGKVGGIADWDRKKDSLVKPLMTWKTVAELARSGIEFGAHGVTHVDLTRVPLQRARDEIIIGKQLIEEKAGCRVSSFAAPFGRSNSAIRSEVTRNFMTAVGTTLEKASHASDPYDLPRIEMWYFRNPLRWREYLGGSTGYFLLRKTLRRVRTFTSVY